MREINIHLSQDKYKSAEIKGGAVNPAVGLVPGSLRQIGAEISQARELLVES